MTNKEKFLAGMWFSLNERSQYSFCLFSFCKETSCIQDRNNAFHCIFDLTADGITVTNSILWVKSRSVDVTFSEMFFYTEEEAKRILNR